MNQYIFRILVIFITFSIEIARSDDLIPTEKKDATFIEINKRLPHVRLKSSVVMAECIKASIATINKLYGTNYGIAAEEIKNKKLFYWEVHRKIDHYLIKYCIEDAIRFQTEAYTGAGLIAALKER